MKQAILVAEYQQVESGLVAVAAQVHQLLIVEVLHVVLSGVEMVEVPGVGEACRSSQVENAIPTVSSIRLKH